MFPVCLIITRQDFNIHRKDVLYFSKTLKVFKTLRVFIGYGNMLKYSRNDLQPYARLRLIAKIFTCFSLEKVVYLQS
jgi:hypothetical protein